MKKIAGVVALLLLAGCSSGPSNSAMEGAFLTFLHENDPSASIDEFKHGDCAHSGDKPGYTCSVQAKITYMKGANKADMEGNFVFDKIDGDWKVISQVP